ncbi:MAG TPA: hybrid sensor histidine kinase/response regulator [Proteobacteria bacterium]|nr:hybrid sensor histidine kinase/response regulator [Pseudomonadota bacterium]
MVVDKKHSILFVDDEERVLKSLKRGLISEPYRVLLALSGMEALEIMAREPVRVIVSDMKMPEMNGLELLQQVALKYPDVVRLVLSGYSHTSTVIAAVNEGRIFRYITKPWSVDNDIKPALNAALGLYEKRLREHQEAARLQNDNLHLQTELVDGRRAVSQTKKVAGEIYLRKTNVQRRSLGRMQNLLNQIAGLAVNLEMEDLDPDSRQMATAIRTICHGALEGLDKVFLYNALEAGDRQPQNAEVELFPLLGELEAETRKRARENALTVVFEKAKGLPQKILTDAELLRRMLWELLDNALVFTPAGGILVCSCEFFPVVGEVGRARLQLTVRDTGPGLDYGQVKDLLQPFACGENSRNRPVWGVV